MAGVGVAAGRTAPLTGALGGRGVARVLPYGGGSVLHLCSGPRALSPLAMDLRGHQVAGVGGAAGHSAPLDQGLVHSPPAVHLRKHHAVRRSPAEAPRRASRALTAPLGAVSPPWG